jgi:hypothetical protein
VLVHVRERNVCLPCHDHTYQSYARKTEAGVFAAGLTCCVVLVQMRGRMQEAERLIRDERSRIEKLKEKRHS